MTNKNPFLAILLSLIPGLGHLYVGERKKSTGFLIVSTGIILTFIFSKSIIMRLLMLGIYLASMGPSALEVYQMARYGRNTFDTRAKGYVIFLLLTTGFTALPLLWQSDRFSRGGKIAWTIAVPVLAILFFTVLIQYWTPLENYLEK